jgi:hypothetical protein
MKIGFAIRPVVAESNSLSPEHKRKHKHARRQSQHHPKKHSLNRRHRRPQAFDIANLSRLVRIVVVMWRRWPSFPAIHTAFAAEAPRIPTKDRTPIKLILKNELY